MSTTDYAVTGSNSNALFTLKLHRGDGMTLLAMNWKEGKPGNDFVGFAIEYREPGGNKFYPLKNMLSFPDKDGKVKKESTSTLQAPIQLFRWIHFPYNADIPGDFDYKVTPVFMGHGGELSYGEPQQCSIQLMRQTWPGKLNVAFTRGFVSSQAFVNRYGADAIPKLIPSEADRGLDFKSTFTREQDALAWMGFEARSEILNLLDTAIADPHAEVKVVAYDLNMPEIVDRLVKLGKRLFIIIDNSGDHGAATSAESEAEGMLMKSAGGQVKRQHMGHLQHNKMIVVNGADTHCAVAGSTNFSWRGVYVQSNNALLLYGESVIKPFLDAFKNYWDHDSAGEFADTDSAELIQLPFDDLDVSLAFSPHSKDNALLDKIGEDIGSAKSSLLYSLAFLYQTEGVIKEAIKKVTDTEGRFVYGISDKKVSGLTLQKPNGELFPVYPSEISKDLPEPFKSEPKGGGGVRMHHKFVVIDFDKPSARVYIGSYNFSKEADTKNGENLLLIRDKRVATSYMIEALSIFDHYHFRVAQKEAKKKNEVLCLQRPPNEEETPWWDEYWSDDIKIQDRTIFS